MTKVIIIVVAAALAFADVATPGLAQAQSSSELRMMEMSCSAAPILGYKVDWPRCIQAIKDAVAKQGEAYEHRIQLLEMQVQTLRLQIRSLQAESK